MVTPQEWERLPPTPPRFRLTPEFRLLLACCAPAPDPGLLTSLATTDIDWKAFASLVARHQVTALVYAALCRYAADNVPGKIKEELKRRTLHARGRALVHTGEVVRLNRAFAEQGIEAVSLKGVTLSQRLFGDPAMRHVQDIDLMVRPDRLTDADRLLKTQGYRRTFPASELTPKMWQRMLLQDHHLAYTHDEFRVAVELHWNLDLWTSQNVQELWNYGRKMELMGSTFWELNEDALLLVLCSHGAGHRWSRLKWLNDVAVLLAQERVTNWNDLFALAARFDLERALAQTALLVHWLFGTRLAGPLPALVTREKSSVELAGKALQAMLMGRKELQSLERYGLATSLAYTLRLRKNLPLRVYMRKIWISSAYFNDPPVPDKLFWLHYVLRPVLWFRNRLFRLEASAR